MKPKEEMVVVGSVALDTVETVHGKRREALGGAAVYCSLASRYFARPMMIGVVGTDFPKRYLTLVRRTGIDTEGVQQVAGESFRWAGKYSPDGNVAHTLETRLGVFSEFKPRVPDSYRSAKVLFLANIDPELQFHVLTRMNGALSGGDTMNFWISQKRAHLLKVLRRLHLMFLNDQEARMLTGEHNLIKAARGLLRMGPRAAVVKKGEHGSMICTDSSFRFCPPHPVQVVKDPTGAGDSYAGAFMGYLAQKKIRPDRLTPDLLACASAYGSVVSSFTVQSFGVGGLLSMKWPLILQRLKTLRRLVHLPSK